MLVGRSPTILVAGSITRDYSRPGALVRLTSTGALDTSISQDGLVEFDTRWPDHWCAGPPQSDGTIVLGGAAFTGAGSGEDESLLARLTEDGTLDTAFGDGGVVIQPGPPESFLGFTNGCDDVVTQADGKIVLVTSSTSPYGYGGPVFAARFLTS